MDLNAVFYGTKDHKSKDSSTGSSVTSTPTVEVAGASAVVAVVPGTPQDGASALDEAGPSSSSSSGRAAGNGNNSSATDLSTKSSKNSSAYDFNASDSFGPSEKTIPPMRKDSPAKVRYFGTFLREI